MQATITLTLTNDQIERILQVLYHSKSATVPATSEFPVQAEAHEKADRNEPPVSGRKKDVKSDFRPEDLRYLLNGRILQVVRFVVAHGEGFFNHELAAEVGFDNPAHTSSLLGKITGKLRRVGVQAEGSDGVNWYQKYRVRGGTLLRVRPDVLKVFADATSLTSE